MRIVLVGGSPLVIHCAQRLINDKHDVIIIEEEADVIEELSEKLDCSFIEGNATLPLILKETDPKTIDALLCLTKNDSVNIVVGLVGRSLEFKNVMIGIQDPDLEHVCNELGLSNTIVPIKKVSHDLVNAIYDQDAQAFENLVKGEASLFAFDARPEDAGPLGKLNLPAGAMAVWFYRGDQFHLAKTDTLLKEGDYVVVATVRSELKGLRKQFQKSGQD